MDKNLTFHKAVAWMIIAASTMHIMAHYYNYERITAIVRFSTSNDTTNQFRFNNSEGVRLLANGTVRPGLVPPNTPLVW